MERKKGEFLEVCHRILTSLTITELSEILTFSLDEAMTEKLASAHCRYHIE
jgi:hypothetical protein